MSRAAGPATIAALALAAVLLLIVAIVNGGPIAYPDSGAYLLDGERLASGVAPYAVRPVFYGVAVWALQWRNWFWPALAAQALIAAHLLWLVLGTVGARPGIAGFLGLVLGLVVLTPVAWHVAHLLPDIFVAVLVLALFLLGFCADALGRWERAYLVILAAAATGFHLTAFPVAVVLVALVWAATFRWRAHPAWAALPLALALAGSLGFNYLVWQRLTLSPNSPPVLLARVLADGPGRDFLRARCPAAGFALCRYLDQLPDTEDGFTWRLLPALPVLDGKLIKAEAGAVVEGTVRMFPGRVFGHMVANAFRQLVTFGAETQLSDEEWAEFQRGGTDLARATADTLQARRFFERPALDPINAVQAGVVGLSLVAAVLMLARGTAWRPAALMTTVLVALAANAFITGAFGGVFARYEGRVIWLLPFAVAAALLSRRSDGS